jgi:hypothetical protein
LTAASANSASAAASNKQTSQHHPLPTAATKPKIHNCIPMRLPHCCVDCCQSQLSICCCIQYSQAAGPMEAHMHVQGLTKRDVTAVAAAECGCCSRPGMQGQLLLVMVWA